MAESPVTVKNTGFLLERLGQDCHPLQFLRELTQNSIEAILRTESKIGEIRWDVDWTSYDLDDSGTYKLSVADNGDGMTGEDMVRFINHLSSSLTVQTFDGNFGVGAKIAAATRNPAGLIYMSWKEGRGSMIHLWRDPTGQYGLRQIERPDGSFGHFGELEENVKPDFIQDHGTLVILLGARPDTDTMRPPEGIFALILLQPAQRFYQMPLLIGGFLMTSPRSVRTAASSNLLAMLQRFTKTSFMS
jgi:hypothetical protein